MHKQILVLGVFLLTLPGCKTQEKSYHASLDTVADEYVKLALAIGQYDPDFIDAYYGPEDWRPAKSRKKNLPYEEFRWRVNDLLNQLGEIDDADFEALQMLRYKFLHKQLSALQTKLDMMAGKELPFDVESLALYDAVSPTRPTAYYDSLLRRLDTFIPGEGKLGDRYLAYSKQFIIPPDLLDTVFKAAIYAARQLVLEQIKLPDNESFVVEYVNNRPWSGYNWYKGNAHSLIQVNIDLPIYIERAIDLACHEGYPGHHVFNTMLEQHLVKEQGWHEFQVYPLFSPQSFIAEGTANFGKAMAFPQSERLRFEKNILFPLAGLNPELAEQYYAIQDIRRQLKFAETETARHYLNKAISSEEASLQLEKYLQYSPERARQRLQFYDKYRSYVINYSLGQEMVRQFVEESTSDSDERWRRFIQLLSTPRTASGI
jgi:hypothetical protein